MICDVMDTNGSTSIYNTHANCKYAVHKIMWILSFHIVDMICVNESPMEFNF